MEHCCNNLDQAERERIKAIDEIAPYILDKQMVETAKYGPNRCTAQELACRATLAGVTTAVTESQAEADVRAYESTMVNHS